MVLYVCFSSLVYKNGWLECELTRFLQLISCLLSYLESWKYTQFTIIMTYVHCLTECAHHFHATNVICKSKELQGQLQESDCSTKMLVTLLFNDGFQKFKNSFKAEDFFFKVVLFVLYQVTFITVKNPEL